MAGWLEETQKKYKLTPASTGNTGTASSSGTGWLESVQKKQPQQVYTQYQPKKVSTTPVKIVQPKKPNLIEQAGNVVNQVAKNTVSGVKSLITPPKKLISPVAESIPIRKLPSSGFKLSLVDSKQSPSAQLQSNKQTLTKQKKQVSQVNQTSDNVQKFFDSIGTPINQGLKTLSKGIVPNVNQLQPQKEYTSEAEYKKALAVSKQEAQGKFDTGAQVNRLLGQALVKTIETSSLGILQGNVIPKNKLEEVSSQIATYAPLVGVPIKSLVKFFAVSTVFDVAFNKVTGKQQISDLLPNDTPRYIKTGVDLLEFLGKALISHGIRPGKIRDTFIRKTVEDKGIPTSYYMSAKEVQDVVIGKNTGYQKDILSKLNMTSSEWRKAVKSGAQVEIPTSTIVTVTDRPYWAKLKSMFGVAPSDPKVTVISPQPKVTNIAGLISPGEYTPEELQQKIIHGPLRNTEDGKALMKTSIEAQQQGKNVHVGDLPKVIADALNQTQIESARKQIRVKEDSAYKNSIEKKSTQELYNEPLKLRDKYISKFGNVVNPDLARTLSPDYKGVNSSSLDNFGIGLKNIVYNHLLETGKEKTNTNNTVLWTGGGPGSTKSTSLNNIPEDQRNKYVAIVDSTFSPNSSFDNVKKALNKGYKAETLFTLSDPFESWKRVINRALDKNSIDYNRVVSEEYFINAHEKARDNIVKTYEKFKDNPNYIGRFYKKLGTDPATSTNVDFVKNYKYNADTLRRRINEYTDKLKSEGKISEELYKGLTSDRARQNVAESKQESTKPSNSSKQTSEVNKPTKKTTTLPSSGKKVEQQSQKVGGGLTKIEFDRKVDTFIKSYASGEKDVKKYEDLLSRIGDAQEKPKEFKKIQDKINAIEVGNRHAVKELSQILHTYDSEVINALSKYLDTEPRSLKNFYSYFDGDLGTKPVTETPYTLSPSIITNDKELLAELTAISPTRDFSGFLKIKNNALESDKHKFNYQKPLIGKQEFKKIVENSKEFKENPVLTYKLIDGRYYFTFEGKGIQFKIVPESMQLDVEKIVNTLKEGDQIKVNLEALKKGKQSQMRVYKNGQVFASVGDYADIKNRTEEIQNSPIVEFPELVQIAKELMGQVPSVALPRFRPSLGGRPNGLFTPVGNGKIKLNPSIFKTPAQAAKTLAHELGHLADYLPEKTMSRGNLLGRIASLNHYLKTFLKESPNSEFDLISAEDRAKIRAMAQKEGRKNFEVVTTEVAVGKEPTNPEEILSIWRDNTASIKNPELNDYIASLSDERKKEIVVAAMRNKIPEWVTFMHTVKEKVTMLVIKNSPEDIRALYKKKLKEEILKRRLFDLETIKRELTQLSQKWKPFNANLSPESFVLYRQSPAELYADAVSVLFNDPALLKEDAPTFWKAFFNYADQKPQVWEAIKSTWELLNKGEEAVFEKRQKDVEQMFDNSEQVFTAKNLEKVKEKTNLMYTLKLLFNNENEPIIRKVNQARKQGKTILDEKNPIYPYEGLNYMDGKLENFVQENFQPIFSKSQEMSSDGWQKLGSVLLYERSMNERGELANPLGFNPKTAQDQLNGLEKSMKPEDWNTLQEALKLFRNANEKILKMARDSEFYSPELLAQMEANKSYATYQVIDYLDTYVSAHVSRSIGTLKDIANPATSTVMKGISVVKAIERNNAKKTAVAFFKENFPDEIIPAKSVFAGKGRRQFVESQDPDMKMIKLIENGQMTAYYVEKDLADTINGQTNTTIIKTAKIARVLTGAGIYRPLFTSLNLGFSTFNFVRDFHRYWTNVPDYTLLDALTSFPRAIYRYGRAVPSASRRARGLNDKTITEMKNLNILGATYRGVFEHQEVNPEDKQIERIMKRFDLMPQGEKKTLLTPFLKILDGIDGFNNFIETLPKVAGYMELKGKGRMTPHQLADFVRNDIGSPNFRTKGLLTPVSNSILLFSNAIKEGIKSDVQVATGKKGKQSAGGFWWKTIASTMLPTMLMFAGTIGLLGKWYQDRMNDVSEYDKTNFTIIPTGVDSDGKTTYLRVPRAETQRFIGGLLWKVMRNASRKDLRLEDVFDVFDYGAGQLPNVTPLWAGVGSTISYLSGHNPYDYFRNRNIIPDTEFKAGFKYSLPLFVDWLAKNQGAGIMLPSYVPKDPTKLQQVLSYPFVSNVIGRWLKSSNFGQTEGNIRINQNIDRQNAQQNLETRDKLDKALKEYKSGEQSKERKVKIVRKLINDVVGTVRTSDDKRKRTNLIKKFEISLARGQNDPLTNSIIDANTNDAKIQILLNAKKNLGSGFKSYVNTLYKQKVLSVNVIKELNRRK